MTVVKQVTQVMCDDCRRAWIYPEGDIDAFLTAHEWVVDQGRHVCPCCARRVSDGPVGMHCQGAGSQSAEE